MNYEISTSQFDVLHKLAKFYKKQAHPIYDSVYFKKDSVDFCHENFLVSFKHAQENLDIFQGEKFNFVEFVALCEYVKSVHLKYATIITFDFDGTNLNFNGFSIKGVRGSSFTDIETLITINDNDFQLFDSLNVKYISEILKIFKREDLHCFQKEKGKPIYLGLGISGFNCAISPIRKKS